MSSGRMVVYLFLMGIGGVVGGWFMEYVLGPFRNTKLGSSIAIIFLISASCSIQWPSSSPKNGGSKLCAISWLKVRFMLLSGAVIGLPEGEWLKNSGKWVITSSDHKMSVESGYTTTIYLEKQS